MVGVKNPFVNHPDFISKVDELEKLISHLNLKDYISLHEWVSYEDRADWYCDCDLIVTLNKDGFENSLSWRTRLVDYVWSGMPVASNGGDPLSEDLIRNGAAARLCIDSPVDLAFSLKNIITNVEKLAEMKLKMQDYRPKLYWENICKNLVNDIVNLKS